MVSKPFDMLSDLGKFCADKKISLRDLTTKEAFMDHVNDAVDRALADPTLLYGQRAEAMFEALLISLGEFKLLKAEDNGPVFPRDTFRTPDFRVVLNDGANWLIEVKNVHESDPFNQQRKLMTRAYREAMEAYAAATGAELKLAVFWSRWSLWTLISPSRFVDGAGDVVLDMLAATKVNELGRLGDMTIGTRPPLRLRLITDPEQTSQIGPDGMVQSAISSAQIFCDDVEITDPTEQEIAWIFMQHGEWEELESEAITENGLLSAIEFRWEPRERGNEDFEFIGRLSRMFARYFAEHTIKDNAVVQLHAPLRPGWFAPLICRDYKGKELPLWRFILQPNAGPTADKR